MNTARTTACAWAVVPIRPASSLAHTTWCMRPAKPLRQKAASTRYFRRLLADDSICLLGSCCLGASRFFFRFANACNLSYYYNKNRDPSPKVQLPIPKENPGILSLCILYIKKEILNQGFNDPFSLWRYSGSHRAGIRIDALNFVFAKSSCFVFMW